MDPRTDRTALLMESGRHRCQPAAITRTCEGLGGCYWQSTVWSEGRGRTNESLIVMISGIYKRTV